LAGRAPRTGIDAEWRTLEVLLSRPGDLGDGWFHFSIGDVMPEGAVFDFVPLGLWRLEVRKEETIPTDVGIFICDHGAAWGVKKWCNPDWEKPWPNATKLERDLDFWHDPVDERVFVKYPRNPGTAFTSIGRRAHLLVKRHAHETLAPLRHGAHGTPVPLLEGSAPARQKRGGVPELLLHDRRRARPRRPDVRTLLHPILGTATVHALLQDRLRTRSIRRVRDGPPRLAAPGPQRPAPQPATAEEDPVAGFHVEAVHLVECPHGGRLARPGGRVVAAFAVHKPRLRDGAGRHGNPEEQCRCFHGPSIAKRLSRRYAAT